MKKLSNKEYAKALYEATRDRKGSELQKIIGGFAKILFRTGSVKQTDAIIVEFIKISKKAAGIIDIEIISAKPLNSRLVGSIKEKFGNNVEEVSRIEPSLLGGVKIKTENMIFDASIVKQLQLLKQKF